MEKRINNVWGLLSGAYDSLGTPAGERISHLHFVGMFDNNRARDPANFPELKTKAAISRHSIAALSIVYQYLPVLPEHCHKIRRLLKHLRRFYDAVAYHGMWFDPVTAQRVYDDLHAVAVLHQELTEFMLSANRRIFHFTEKAHYVEHVALDVLVTRFNPRFAWCYLDEDFMGRMASLIKATLRGRGPLGCGPTVMHRWRAMTWLRLTRRQRLAAL